MNYHTYYRGLAIEFKSLKGNGALSDSNLGILDV